MAHPSVASGAKRALDVLVAVTVLGLLSPIALLVALAVRVANGAPLLFRQTRAGLNGAPFSIMKFRTMRGTPAPGDTPEIEAARLTTVGRVLRATSLDELPQFVSVLRGQMSLVGPRPLPLRYLSRYTPDERRRHDVRPGITGWAQINGRNALEWDERLRLDVWYVDNWRFALDLRILARTARDVVMMRNTSSAKGGVMPEFRGELRG